MVSVSRGPDIVLRNKVDQLLQEMSINQNIQLKEILDILKGLQDKLDTQGKVLTNIAMFVSKLHQEGKLNQETFDKLDHYLKEYYDESNLLKDY